MNPIRPSVLSALAMAALAGAPHYARAQDASDSGAAGEETGQARSARLKADGDDAMQRLAYDRALALYDEAYAVDPNPALLYNRGRAYQALARFPEALRELESFRDKAPPEMRSRVPKLAELIAEIEKRVSTLVVTSNVEGARVSVRRLPVGTTPLAPVRLNAGPARVEVTAEGHHPHIQEVTLPSAGTLKLAVRLHSQKTTGVLEVSSPVAGAVVTIGDQRLGSAPVQAILPAGTHRVVVRKDGYDDAETQAVVSVGGHSRLQIGLEPHAAVTERWWFWTGVGVVVVAGVAVTAALLTERDPDSGTIAPGQVSGPLLRF